MSECAIAEFYEETKHKARKEHMCCECRLPIRVGQEYMECRGKWDGDFHAYKQHVNCWTFCREVINAEAINSLYDECVGFGEVDYEIGNYDPGVRAQWDAIKATNRAIA